MSAYSARRRGSHVGQRPGRHAGPALRPGRPTVDADTGAYERVPGRRTAVLGVGLLVTSGAVGTFLAAIGLAATRTDDAAELARQGDPPSAAAPAGAVEPPTSAPLTASPLLPRTSSPTVTAPPSSGAAPRFVPAPGTSAGARAATRPATSAPAPRNPAPAPAPESPEPSCVTCEDDTWTPWWASESASASAPPSASASPSPTRPTATPESRSQDASPGTGWPRPISPSHGLQLITAVPH